MNRRLRIILPVAALVTLVTVIAWPRIGTILNPPGDELVYVVLKTTGPHMEFWQIVRAGIQAAATEYEVAPVIVGPRWEKDVDEQINILNGVIDLQPDGIILAASDYNRLVEPAERAAARGITIVTLDSALNSDVAVSFVATDNIAAGRKAGAEINSLVAPDKKVALISHIRGVATAIDREKGVREALSGRPEEHVLGTFYSVNDPDVAYEIVTDLVAEHPDLAGIVAMNENSTVGAGRALSDLNVYDRISLVGFDNSEEEIEFLERGVVDALVVQRPFNMGYLGIRAVTNALRGKSVPPVIHTDSVLVRADDMFTEEIQKLLFPIVQNESQGAAEQP